MIRQGINLPNYDLCTGCGACIQACPTKAISFVKDDMDVVYPHISVKKCIECGKCFKVCPLNNNYYLPKGENVFAGWSCDNNIRKTSASGGIASSIYLYAISIGYKCYGVNLSSEGEASFIMIDSLEDIEKVQNSKYVYSYTNNIYCNIQKQLALGEKVVFIGLPCQVAGLLGFLGGRKENLILIDIVCHGTCSEDYLKQHINKINNKTNKVLFRDPKYGTNRFVLSLYDGDKRLYSSIVEGKDVYQIGYHKGIIYRENCYHCQFACPQRVGDITLSDFSGLGKVEEWSMQKDNISCVISSSITGNNFLKEMVDEQKISLFPRPIDEAYKYEKQLKAPSKPHPARAEFVSKYKKTKDFESTLKQILKKQLLFNSLRMFFKIDEIKQFIRKVIPRNLKNLLKTIRKK